MAEAKLVASLIECFSNDSVVSALKKLLSPIVSEAVEVAVSAAVAAKDAEIKALKADLRKVTDRLNDVEQYSRRVCVNISGIPENRNEDAAKIVLELSKITGAHLEPGDVDVAHRIGKPKPGKIRPIIARFVTLQKRQAFYDTRRALRGAQAQPGSELTRDVLDKAFISDSLTQQNEFLMYQARQLKKKGKLVAAWSDQGKLKVKEKQGSSTRIFRSTDDLRSLCGNDPVLDEVPAFARQPEAAVAATADESGFREVPKRRLRSTVKQ